MSEMGLHLSPLGNPSQRRWILNSDDNHPPTHSAGSLEFAVNSESQQSFAAARALIFALSATADAVNQRNLSNVTQLFDEILPLNSHGIGTTRTGFLVSGVAFAVLRRISRESVHTATLIDETARVLNDTIATMDGIQEVRLRGMDYVDRPSLKIFARAMLTIREEHKFRWAWLFSDDPLVATPDDDWTKSRIALLHSILPILDPTISRRGRASTRSFSSPRIGTYSTNLHELAADLVLQNYDRCFLSLRDWDANSDKEFSEALRLCAIAFVNTGEYDRAMGLLKEAENLTIDTLSGAHLAYLQGLVCAKRRYHLVESDEHYHRGLRSLDACSEPDANLERAWLCNGLALNEVLRWRKDKLQSERFKSAFKLVNNAFERTKLLSGPAATYLQFNLIANSAFLVEMQGQFEQAAELFQKAFDLNELDQDLGADMTLGYRIGVLHLRAGRLDSAREYLNRADNWCRHHSCWANREVVLRALGELERFSNNIDAAEAAHREGLRICLEARASRGALHHAKSLCQLALLRGSTADTQSIIDGMSGKELTSRDRDYIVAECRTNNLQPLPSKLPAYIPEVDLEALPAVDLNRYMTAVRDEHSENAIDMLAVHG